MGHRMLPRTTQPSHSAVRCGGRASDRTMVGHDATHLLVGDAEQDRTDPEMRGGEQRDRQQYQGCHTGAGCQEKQNLPAEG